MSEQESQVIYNVVVNHEEQYSLWTGERENAPGWRDAGFRGTKDECLAYVREHWTDMRPLSLRLQMEARQQATAAAAVSASNTADAIADGHVAVVEAIPVATSIAVADTPVAAQPAPEIATDTAPPSPPQMTGDAPVAGEQKQSKGFFGKLFGRK